VFVGIVMKRKMRAANSARVEFGALGIDALNFICVFSSKIHATPVHIFGVCEFLIDASV
jgi:hypothetical protein